MGRAVFGILHGIGSRVEGAGGVAIHGYMVGVSIAAGFVKCDQHLRAELANDSDQLAYHLGCASLRQAARVLIFRGAGHARIAIIQEPQVMHAEHFSRRAHLALAHLAQVFGRG